MKTLLVTTSNAVNTIDYPTDFDFRWVAKQIGCSWIEIVRPEKLPPHFVMLIDEEGRLKPNRINWLCSWLYGAEHHGEPIVGNALIVKEDLINGEPDICGLTDDEIDMLINLLREGESE